MSWKKSLIKYCIKLILTVTVMGILVYVVGWQEIGNALLETTPMWLLFMYLGMLSNRLITAFQMHTLLGWVGLNVNTSRVFLANSLSVLYSLIVPGDLIAAGAKWANLSAATGKKSMVLNAIIYNRLALLLPPLLLGCTALILDDPFQLRLLRVAIFGLLLLTIIGAVLLYHPGLDSVTDRIVFSIIRFLPKAVASRIEMMITSLNAFRAIKPLHHLVILTISIGSVFVGVAVFVSASYAVGIKVPILTLAWTLVLLQVVRMAPITISNIGVREGLLVVILGMYGITAEKAVALGLIMFSSSLLTALIGLGYQFALTMGWARWDSRSVQLTSMDTTNDKSAP